MGEILVIIVIWVIVSLIKGKGRGQGQQSRNIQSYQNGRPSAFQPQAKRQVQAAAEQMQQAAAAMSQKQKELKARLQQKYPGMGSAQSYQARPASQSEPLYQTRQTKAGRPEKNVRQTVTSGDILARAAENVRENDGDLLEQEDFLAKVETLMITGYQSKLTYERDFLSEGMDLLNSYRLPDAMPEFAESEM